MQKCSDPADAGLVRLLLVQRKQWCFHLSLETAEMQSGKAWGAIVNTQYESLHRCMPTVFGLVRRLECEGGRFICLKRKKIKRVMAQNWTWQYFCLQKSVVLHHLIINFLYNKSCSVKPLSPSRQHWTMLLNFHGAGGLVLATAWHPWCYTPHYSCVFSLKHSKW